jgi:hypothetical protein
MTKDKFDPYKGITDEEKELHNSVPPADTMTKNEVAIKQDKYVVLSLDVDDAYAFERNDGIMKLVPAFSRQLFSLDSEWASLKLAKQRFDDLKMQTSNAYLFKVIDKSECI